LSSGKEGLQDTSRRQTEVAAIFQGIVSVVPYTTAGKELKRRITPYWKCKGYSVIRYPEKRRQPPLI